MMAFSFVGLLMVFLVVGLLSTRHKSPSTEDYLLASRSLGPWTIGLSTMATGQSGFKFIGLVGYAYSTGVSSIWLILGWFIGDFIAWTSKVPETFRRKSAQEGTLTFPQYLSEAEGKMSHALAFCVGLIIVVFLSSYAAAQLASAGKALQSTLAWSYQTGIYISSILIVLYCFGSGIRASIWTDVAQAIVMLGGMYALAAMSLSEAGGLTGFIPALRQINPQLTEFFPSSTLAFTIMLASLIASGVGVLGQPHIMVRSMALDQATNMALVRRIYLYLGYTMSLGSYIVGLSARIIFSSETPISAEMIMPQLTQLLFHPLLAGVLLAALFASAISTADSQVLVCSSAFLTRKNSHSKKHYYILKGCTCLTVLFTATIALNSTSVFTLVVFSWSVLASSLAPLLVVKTLFQRPPVRICLAMITLGGSTAILWRLTGLTSIAFETLPGILAGTVPCLFWLMIKLPQKTEGGQKSALVKQH